MSTIGVGIIGASPQVTSWAAIAHVPALRAVPGIELRAVATSRLASAREAAQAYGVTGYDDPRALIGDPAVDLVVVAVKVPAHYDLAATALAAGKPVYCEWPLAPTLSQAESLADQARTAGLRTAVGLQGRYAPQVQAARDLVSAGALGTVQSMTLTGSGVAWGARTDRAHAYLYDAASGATTLTAAAMHALDAATFVLGPLDRVSATLAIAQQDVRLIEDGSPVTVTAPDQVAVTGTFAGGAVLSAFYRGGVSAGDNLRWEVSGSEGELVITSATPGNGNLQAIELDLSVRRAGEPALTPVTWPAEPMPAAPAGNVARLYAAWVSDQRTGTETVPDFAHAARQHRLADAVVTAGTTGHSVQPL